MPRAAGLAAAIAEAHGVEPTLIEGAGGVFEVAVDGRRIFAKREAGRFPETAEILAALKT